MTNDYRSIPDLHYCVLTKAHEIRERAHRLESENDARDDALMYSASHLDIGGHE
jgi:hypothetical protein